MADKKSIFRKESLERLSSPERLDQLMQLVNPLDWLTLATLGSLLFIGLVWSIFGRIPITVSGKGILIQPNQVITVKPPIQGKRLIAVSYFNVKDGKQIQPGMTMQITPDFVTRERFGGIFAKVTSVSALPITKERANSVIGNPDLVTKILPSGGGDMEVQAEMVLEPSTFSGYRWSSSQGPKLKISAGTTTSVRVKVAEQAPITYILPILREFTGID